MSGRPLSLTRHRITVLHVLLDADGPLTAAAISARALISMSTVTENLYRLEEHGWVEADKPKRRQGLVRQYVLLPRARPIVEAVLAQRET